MNFTYHLPAQRAPKIVANRNFSGTISRGVSCFLRASPSDSIGGLGVCEALPLD